MAKHNPQRILVTISNTNAYWEQAWSASKDILPIAIKVLQERDLLEGGPDIFLQPDLKLKLLAKQKWTTRVFLVFDIGNLTYDPSLGHLPEQNQLPVLIVRLGRSVQAYKASPPAQNKVNRDIARAHNNHGIDSLPPFVTDYTSGSPFYPRLRDPALLV
ncbi:hypothetical protein BJX70DRAFT_66063 [Aspergillus crustosus]